MRCAQDIGSNGLFGIVVAFRRVGAVALCSRALYKVPFATATAMNRFEVTGNTWGSVGFGDVQ